MSTNTMIPVTILTGFLGAGKTTLLNRILKAEHGHKIAVIENEFGPESVDNDLLVREDGEQIVEMNNGCVCCTVRGDLVRILGELAAKRRTGKLKFDRVVIETTGMANPGPVTQTFFMDDEVAESYLLDGVVTVVDAKHGGQTLDEQDEAQAQVGFADRILLSKTDLVTPEEAAAIKARLVAINPRAPIKPVAFGDADVSDVLDIKGFNLNAILDIDPDFLAGRHEHSHEGDVGAFAFTSDKPFDGARLDEFLSSIVQVFGESLLRYKGVLFIKGMDRRVIFQGVHMMMGSDMGKAWGKDKRTNKMVFIGRKLPQDVILKGLEQCLVS
ncbi:CobW family GTP-binding protein [Derxia lacustris]|uniref:CobW family GTP-binding protein n=1 Tax=Derxia lacustris TaxID=764842 RepID=UPI00111BF9DB|nr:GTP-binding protein [Derxia lacustris]